MGAVASQNTSVSIVCSTVCSGADQRKHQSSASLDFVRGIHRPPVESPHKGRVTRKMFPFDDVTMQSADLTVLHTIWHRATMFITSAESNIPAEILRNNDVNITPKRRHFDVTSFRRYNDVFIKQCVQWDHIIQPLTNSNQLYLWNITCHILN